MILPYARLLAWCRDHMLTLRDILTGPALLVLVGWSLVRLVRGAGR